MNGKQARRARAAANQEAQRRGLWSKGVEEVKGRGLKKVFFRLFPHYRSRMIDMVGRWYRRNLKSFAKQIAYLVKYPNQDMILERQHAKIRANEERNKLRENHGRPILIRPSK